MMVGIDAKVFRMPSMLKYFIDATHTHTPFKFVAIGGFGSVLTVRALYFVLFSRGFYAIRDD